MRTNHVVSLIGRIRFLAHRQISQELERLGHPGLVPSHGSILNKLYELGPLPMNRLARIIGRRKNTVTTLVRKLEDTGYVRRMPSPQDARVAMISLTPKGEAFRPHFEAVTMELLEQLWGDIPEFEREQVVALLERIEENMS